MVNTWLYTTYLYDDGHQVDVQSSQLSRNADKSAKVHIAHRYLKRMQQKNRSEKRVHCTGEKNIQSCVGILARLPVEQDVLFTMKQPVNDLQPR